METINIQLAKLDCSQVSRSRQLQKVVEEMRELQAELDLVDMIDTFGDNSVVLERFAAEAFDVMQALKGALEKYGVDITVANEAHLKKMNGKVIK